MTKRKKRRSWGSITTITKTKHVLRWPENTPEGRKRRSYTFYGTYKEANLWLDIKHAELQQEEKNEITPTVDKVYRIWYLPQLEKRFASGDISKNTYNSFIRAYERNIAPEWANTPVNEVKPLKVQEWILTLTRSVAQVSMTVFKLIMDSAMPYEVLDDNILRRKYAMPTQGATRSKDVYKFDELMILLDKARNQPWEAAFIVAGFGGARTGESLAVAKDDLRTIESIGQQFAVVPIKRQLSHIDGIIEERTKNDQSARETLIPLQYGGGRLLEIANSSTSQWLNIEPTGKLISQQKLKYYWSRFTKKDYVPFRNLRNSWRTYAQYLWGVDYDTLELLMGHKIPGMTGAHYLRPSIEDLARKLAEALNRFEAT